MRELKLDLLPDRLRNASGKEADDDNERLNPTKAEEPLPESKRPKKDGPGGE